MASDPEIRQLPVLIVGGGIAGLVLAQALKKRSIPFIVFERDQAANSRLQGWALTIHFGLSALLHLLPVELHEELDRVQVNPTLKYDQSHSVFLNLDDCQVKWSLPPGSGTRKRVARDRFRLMLLEDLKNQLHWGKRFVGFHATDDLTVTAEFDDGSTYTGSLLVGVDGARSKARSLLYNMDLLPPDPIPISFLGTSIEVNEMQVRPLLELDPILFQGCHPESATWMWFSVMETPQVNGTAQLAPDKQVWRIQLCLSWPTEGSDDIPNTDAERVLKMKERSQIFHPKLREFFMDIFPNDHRPILSLKLEDWHLPSFQSPQNLGGRVTLAGDAAHTMAMYRGEGFNHAILDIYHLTCAIQKVYGPTLVDNPEDITGIREQVIATYEANARRRGAGAVKMCREACLEVHRWEKLDEMSTVRQKSIL